MDTISFKNYTAEIKNNQEIQKRMESQESFGAIDKEKIKQDTIELANKTKENAKENFIFRGLRNLGVNDPKKLLISCGLTLATIVSFATLGKKTLPKMSELGIKLDDALGNNKIYQGISGFFTNIKTKVGNFFKKNNTIKEATEILKNKTKKAKPKFQLAKGMGQGFAPQFAYAAKDMIEASSIKAQGETFKTLKKLVGKKKAIDILNALPQAKGDGLKVLTEMLGPKNADKAEELYKQITKNNRAFRKQLTNLIGKDGVRKYYGNFIGYNQTSDPLEFIDDITKSIAKNFGVDIKDKKAFNKLLKDLTNGSAIGRDGKVKDLSFFTNITMEREGLIGGWWPANIVDSIGKKIFKDKWKPFGKGNLGEGLWRYNVSKGNMAKTGLGKLTQNAFLIPGESISNFVCDNAGMNFFLVGSIISLYNNMQDAPKGKKAAVVADDFVGTIGSMAIATPLAFKATYGLASLAKLEGNGLLKTPLKWIGKIFNMGLGENAGALSKFGGGAFRFFMIMMVFSSIFRKPIDKLIHKIFGKPYNKAEEEQKKAQEEQMNQVIPELGVSQKQLMEKIQKNPQAIEKLQSDPQLLAKAQQNPKIIIELLDGTYKENAQSAFVAPKGPKQLSPANKNLINGTGNKRNFANINPATTNATNKIGNTANNKQAGKVKDSATYIPSSEFVAKDNAIPTEQQNEINTILSKADKALARAERFI